MLWGEVAAGSSQQAEADGSPCFLLSARSLNAALRGLTTTDELRSKRSKPRDGREDP
jgi:hypothetical protein